MASMNPGIILGVQQPDFVNTLARSTAAAGMANQNRRQNALEQVYQQYGQDIAQGGQKGLNALAQYDPQAALGMKQTHQSMQFDQEKMRMLRDKAKMDAQMQAAKLSAAERQQAADNLKAVLSGAATLYQQGDRAGYQAWIQQNGLDPAQYTFDQFPAHLASATGTIEALTEAQEYMQGPETYRQVRGSELGLTGEDAGKLFNVGPDNKVSGIGGASTKVEVNTGGPSTPGWEEIDKEFGSSEYLPWVRGGGSDSLKQIGQIKGVLEALKSGQEITGPVLGMQPDAVQAFLNPEALDARQRVEEVVQRNLRQILGAQFTEKEGERLISRAYDQRLRPEQNAARLEALIMQMEAASQAKNAMVQYFGKNGTLQGFEAQGYIPQIADFEALFDKLDERQGISGGQPTGDDLTPEEKQYLGISDNG